MITNPTVGELVDRLGVLKLKIVAARLQGKPYEHFCKEQDGAVEALAAKLSIEPGAKRLQITMLAMDMAAVHQRLWDTEDRRRGWACYHGYQDELMEAAAILEDLGNYNAERVRIREEIDRLTGEWGGEEKL